MLTSELRDEQAISGPCVLLVDDRSENLYALKTSMRCLDATVHTAESGNEALSMMLEHEYAVVILDVQMPGMDGFEVATLMRTHAATRDVPIIFVTAISKEEQYRIRGYETGAVDYLLKPLDPVVLLSKVRVFLRLDEQKIAIERAMQDVRRLSRRNDLILSCTEEGVVGLDPAAKIIFANEAAERAAGLSAPGGLLGQSVRVLFEDNRAARDLVEEVIRSGGRERGVESRFRRADGRTFPVELSVGAVRKTQEPDGGVGGVLVFHDITERKQVAEKLLRLARYDSLTGLANRALFHDALGAALSRAKRTGLSLGVLIVDLDDFKLVNDRFGHDAGDQTLVEVGKCLTGHVRAGDLVARLGGDEFAVILEDAGTAENVVAVAEKIVAQLKADEPPRFKSGGMGCSVGAAIYESSSDTPDSLLKMADTAMYTVKRGGRSGVALFTPSMVLGAHRRARVVAELEIAIRNETLSVAYQPQFRVSDRQLVGMEALVRWSHPELGDVSPGEFISLAEETRQIEQLGDLVLRLALAEYRDWVSGPEGHGSVRLAVNISAAQLRQKNFAARVAELLNEHGVRAEQLELELTETAMMEDPETSIACMNALYALGVKLAVDDFGTGYASLSYLQRFPLETLKIDGSFVARIAEGRSDIALVCAILRLGQELDMRVIAEGVETEEQAEFLHLHRCEVFQGYLLGRPGPVSALSVRAARPVASSALPVD